MFFDEDRGMGEGETFFQKSLSFPHNHNLLSFLNLTFGEAFSEA